MSPAQRNWLANLIFLCPNHHTLIDGPDTSESYPVDRLIQIKSEHEERMGRAQHRANIEGMAQVNYSHLKAVIDHLAASIGPVPTDLDLTPLDEKLDINRLGARTRTKVALGLARATDVGDYLQSPAVGAETAQRIVFEFRAEYNRQRAEGVTGDDLFDAMHAFAAVGSVDILDLNASLALLTYLFETCDVFERAA